MSKDRDLGNIACGAFHCNSRNGATAMIAPAQAIEVEHAGKPPPGQSSTEIVRMLIEVRTSPCCLIYVPFHHGIRRSAACRSAGNNATTDILGCLCASGRLIVEVWDVVYLLLRRGRC